MAARLVTRVNAGGLHAVRRNAGRRSLPSEGVAEVGDVAPNGDVVGGNPVGIEDIGDVVGRVEVAGIRSFSVSKLELFKSFETEKATRYRSVQVPAGRLDSLCSCRRSAIASTRSTRPHSFRYIGLMGWRITVLSFSGTHLRGSER